MLSGHNLESPNPHQVPQDFNMADTNGEAQSKKVVMVTGGTGLVGVGIKEFVESDAEVRNSNVKNEKWNNLRPLLCGDDRPMSPPRGEDAATLCKHDRYYLPVLGHVCSSDPFDSFLYRFGRMSAGPVSIRPLPLRTITIPIDSDGVFRA